MLTVKAKCEACGEVHNWHRTSVQGYTLKPVAGLRVALLQLEDLPCGNLGQSTYEHEFIVDEIPCPANCGCSTCFVKSNETAS